MSSVVLSGDTSGTVTLTVPAVAGTNTVTIANQTGTLNAGGPAFSAYTNSNTTFSTSTQTKVPFNLETFDTNNNFDSATNYRFTPTVAGYYQLNSSVYVYSTAPTSRSMRLYKNGSIYQAGSLFVSTPAADTTLLYSGVVYFNGSTDYAEIYVFDNGTSPTIYGSVGAYFSGCLLRGA